VACIGRAFLWRSSDGDPRTAAVWSLGFADVIDGRLQIVPRGLAACAGGRGVGALGGVSDSDKARIRSRICTIYDRVRASIEDWPECPVAQTASLETLTADATGTPIEGVIAIEGITTGDGRKIERGALTWEDGPWPLVFDREEMDHSGATVGTINTIERVGKEIRGTGALSDSTDPETQMLVARAAELFSEGAVGVSVSLDDVVDEERGNIVVTTAGRIRSVAIVDEAAFNNARMALVASLRVVRREWFADPQFGDESDERLVWQEPERPEEERQLGCPLTVTDDGQIYGHAALWGRCYIGGMPGTCTRPPKEPAAYRGFHTGERLPGIPTGPLVMKTRHANINLEAAAAVEHYAHTGYAVGDVRVGPDAYGIWVAGAVRSDATDVDIEILRASALSGDWRSFGTKLRLVGLLAVNAPGFRVARAIAASSGVITSGPGCEQCDDGPSLEDRVAELEKLIAAERTA
jgi:hypothetical protein